MNASTLRSAFLSLAPALVVCAPLALDSPGRQDPSEPVQKDSEEALAFRVQYLEIVTPDRDGTCELLENVHGVAFGEPVAALGNARTARLAGGGNLGVRAPMHAGEEPVVRPYLSVDDVAAAVEQAAASSGEIAMPATKTADGSEFAIYFHGGIQYGLWKE